MTHGTIAGILLTDLILGKTNPWAPLYDPKRKPKSLASLGEFAKENLNVAAQYVDLLTPGDVQSVDEIAPDTGAILRDGIRKLACYREADGTLHKMSAICPHLQCVVMWNGAEKSWDCPCHGSRFNELGKVVNGPAIDDLPPVA
jgi:Rieske Fe-S protein